MHQRLLATPFAIFAESAVRRAGAGRNPCDAYRRLNGRFLLLLSAGLLLLGVPAGPARADTIVTASWFTFAWADGSLPISATSCLLAFGVCNFPTQPDAPAPPWSITAPVGGLLLTVTDMQTSGDQFRLFDTAIALGDTALASSTAGRCGTDAAACLLSPLHSHGFFLLAEGSHSLTIDVVSANGGRGGTGAFRLDAAPVPEPASFAVMALGMLAVGAEARTRQRR